MRRHFITLISWFLVSIIAVLLGSSVAWGTVNPRATYQPEPSVASSKAYVAQQSMATLSSWQFDPRRHRLVFTTSQGVQPRARLLPNPSRLVIELPDVSLESDPVTQTIGGAYKSISVVQMDARVVQIVLELSPGYGLDPQRIQIRGSSPTEWSAQLPVPQVIAPAASVSSTGSPQGELAIVETVQLEGDRLLVQADRPLRYESGWDRSSTDYRIRIFNATISEQFRRPTLPADSPVAQIRLVQETPDTVVVFVKPAPGNRIGRIAQTRRGLLALEVGRTVGVQPPVIRFPRDPSSAPVGQFVVVIDPGHGGPDPGAIGIGGLREKDVVLPISQEVAALLEQQGIRAILTREDDRDLGLEPRVQLARQVNATIFVSIHANAISLSRPDVNGIETYYYDSGLRLAQVIHRNMIAATGSRDRGVRRARFYVLRRTTMPSVLLETGFVTGAEDAANLADPSFRSRIAAGIAQGILEYLR
ncbi:MAG: N-acetylmuramoyl-L-alanine amidase [Cyanobacteria bacterium]|nr:N-acetylmuramoyl-L-alanine amidase [Cyanobacteriota bacterium]